MIKVGGAVVADAEVINDEAGDFARGVVEVAGSGRFVIASGEEVGG